MVKKGRNLNLVNDEMAKNALSEKKRQMELSAFEKLISERTWAILVLEKLDTFSQRCCWR